MPNPYETDGGQAYHEAVNGGLDERGYALVAQRRAAKMQPFIQKNDAVLEARVGIWRVCKRTAERVLMWLPQCERKWKRKALNL
jgi:hypothetical protein